MPLDDLTREQLARYIDGDIAGEALQAFAQRLRDEPDLRAEMIKQRQINQSLRRLFQAPTVKAPQAAPLHAVNGVSDAPIEPAIAGRLPQPTRERRLLWPKRLGIAAALLLCAGGAWLAWRQFMPAGPTNEVAQLPTPKVLTAADYYQYKVDRGFEPSWVCKDDVEFANTFRDRLGQPLLLKAMPEGSRMLGLDYTTVLTPHTISMLADADGKHVVVLVDKVASDNRERIDADAAARNLHVFRKEVGSLVLYEITPLDQARVMDFLIQPQG